MSPRLRAKTQPEDVTQEVLMALPKALPTYQVSDDRRAFLGWVFVVAENRNRDLADYHGALKRKTIPPRSFCQTSPSVAAVRAETAAHLVEAMDKLQPDYRQVIQLRRLEERDFKEIAEIMDQSKGAVSGRYSIRTMRSTGNPLPSQGGLGGGVAAVGAQELRMVPNSA